MHSDFYTNETYPEVEEFIKSTDLFEYHGVRKVIFNNPGDSGKFKI